MSHLGVRNYLRGPLNLFPQIAEESFERTIRHRSFKTPRSGLTIQFGNQNTQVTHELFGRIGHVQRLLDTLDIVPHGGPTIAEPFGQLSFEGRLSQTASVFEDPSLRRFHLRWPVVVIKDELVLVAAIFGISSKSPPQVEVGDLMISLRRLQSFHRAAARVGDQAAVTRSQAIAVDGGRFQGKSNLRQGRGFVRFSMRSSPFRTNPEQGRFIGIGGRVWP
jgi:hypothetical protein